MDGYLIIAPTQRMLQLLVDVIQENNISGSVYIKQIGNKAPLELPAGFLSAEESSNLKEKKLSLLCCSEEAIYWLSNNMSDTWSLQFSEKYLTLLDKLSFKEFAVNHGAPVSRYWKRADEISEYPVVGKPSIGFASMGVEYLADYEASKQYEEKFKTAMANSIVEKYRCLYFPQIYNEPIFEREVSGDFFRTSFVVKARVCIECFPVKGITQSTSLGKQYSWIEFEYTHGDTIVHKNINTLLTKLSDAFELNDGVYVAEFMGMSNGELFLLELSPRITSSRIVNLIKYATNVDLDLIMIQAFLGIDFNLTPQCLPTARLRIERKTDNFEVLENYVALPSCVETSAHGDDVDCKYFIKKDAVHE